MVARGAAQPARPAHISEWHKAWASCAPTCVTQTGSRRAVQHITCHTFQWFFSHSHVWGTQLHIANAHLAAHSFGLGDLSLASIERRAFGQRRNVKLGLCAIEHFNQTRNEWEHLSRHQIRFLVLGLSFFSRIFALVASARVCVCVRQLTSSSSRFMLLCNWMYLIVKCEVCFSSMWLSIERRIILHALNTLELILRNYYDCRAATIYVNVIYQLWRVIARAGHSHCPSWFVIVSVPYRSVRPMESIVWWNNIFWDSVGHR